MGCGGNLMTNGPSVSTDNLGNSRIFAFDMRPETLPTNGNHA